MYRQAKERWLNLKLPMSRLPAVYYITLKWLLEVTMDAPYFNLELTYNPVLMGRDKDRLFMSVYYKLTENDDIIRIFNNNDIVFFQDANYEMAKKITGAFNKWCELIEEKALCGTRI